MGIGTYPGFVNLLPEQLLQKHAPEEHERFVYLVDKYHISLGQWAHAIDQGEDDMAIDAMQIDLTDEDDEPIPALADIDESEYETKVFEEVVEALNALTDAFKERTGVEVELWSLQAEDYGTSEDLELDEAYWIMRGVVQLSPEAAALGLEFWPSFRDYVITC